VPPCPSVSYAYGLHFAVTDYVFINSVDVESRGCTSKFRLFVVLSTNDLLEVTASSRRRARNDHQEGDFARQNWSFYEDTAKPACVTDAARTRFGAGQISQCGANVDLAKSTISRQKFRFLCMDFCSFFADFTLYCFVFISCFSSLFV